MAKKSSPSVDTSQFFEEPDPAESARARRLARQAEEPVSQPVTPPPEPVLSAKERRLAREKAKELETQSQPKKAPKEKVAKPSPKRGKGKDKAKGQETSQNQVGASPHVPSEADKQARFYWERTIEVCKNDDHWETYCDGRLVDKSPITKAGCVAKKA
jgi:hypothetical protein